MTKPKLRRPCVDCQSLTRPAPYPGPRCATDDRAARKRRRLKARAAYLLRTYNITLEAYLAMLAAQGGTCAWPGCPASGKARFLAVDHDHACCPGRKSCGKCVRGLLRFVHNRAIGQAGDDPTVFEGAAAYLRRPRHLTQEEQMSESSPEPDDGGAPDNPDGISPGDIAEAAGNESDGLDA